MAGLRALTNQVRPAELRYFCLSYYNSPVHPSPRNCNSPFKTARHNTDLQARRNSAKVAASESDFDCLGWMKPVFLVCPSRVAALRDGVSGWDPILVGEEHQPTCAIEVFPSSPPNSTFLSSTSFGP